MPELTTWVAGAIVTTGAATIQAVTGFGFALVAIPFLMIIFNPKMAVGLSIIISFCSLLLLLLNVKHNTHWNIAKRLFWGALLGLPIGVTILKFLEIKTLKIIVSAFILILSMSMLFEIKFNIKSKSWFSQFIVGSISGILSTSIGMPGPPVILFLSNMDIPKEKFRATIAAYFVLIYPSSFITLSASGTLPPHTFSTALTLIPFTFLGFKIGNRFFRMIPGDKFKKIVVVMLIIIGSYSIINSIC